MLRLWIANVLCNYHATVSTNRHWNKTSGATLIVTWFSRAWMAPATWTFFESWLVHLIFCSCSDRNPREDIFQVLRNGLTSVRKHFLKFTHKFSHRSEVCEQALVRGKGEMELEKEEWGKAPSPYPSPLAPQLAIFALLGSLHSYFYPFFTIKESGPRL